MTASLVRRSLRPPAWSADGACVGRATGEVDWWSPDDELPAAERARQTALAREVCAGCPVRYACAVEALEDAIPEGLWGGLTPEDRRKVARLYRYPMPGAAACGTRSQYVAGCRCDDCRRSHAEYERARRLKVRALEEAAVREGRDPRPPVSPEVRVVRVLQRGRGGPLTAREVYRRTGVKAWRVRAIAAKAQAAGRLRPGRLAA